MPATNAGCFFFARARSPYEGIGDTFVQLFPPRFAGLIAHVRSAVEKKRSTTGGNTMQVLEIQPAANALHGLPATLGSQELWSEQRLVAKAKSGHTDAFGELYERHKLKAYRAALRILRNRQDAEDAAQKAFQRAFVNLERFREDSAFSTWLTRIAINEALMLLRRRRTPEQLHENSVDAPQGDGSVEIADAGPTPEEILCESERRAALHYAIGRLRKNLRIVVLFVELQGLTSAETARRLGLTVSAVKARIFHARRSLRKHLQRRFKTAGARALTRLSAASVQR
jgi:RNA polymerase sigma-70 factor, ECF subfamily